MKPITHVVGDTLNIETEVEGNSIRGLSMEGTVLLIAQLEFALDAMVAQRGLDAANAGGYLGPIPRRRMRRPISVRPDDYVGEWLKNPNPQEPVFIPRPQPTEGL